MSPNPVKVQNTGVLAGTEEETVPSQGIPLVGGMTVNEFNQALAALANDIKTHISVALKSDIVALTERLEGINSKNPYPIGMAAIVAEIVDDMVVMVEMVRMGGMGGMELEQLKMRLDSISKRVELIKNLI